MAISRKVNPNPYLPGDPDAPAVQLVSNFRQNEFQRVRACAKAKEEWAPLTLEKFPKELGPRLQSYKSKWREDCKYKTSTSLDSLAKESIELRSDLCRFLEDKLKASKAEDKTLVTFNDEEKSAVLTPFQSVFEALPGISVQVDDDEDTVLNYTCELAPNQLSHGELEVYKSVSGANPCDGKIPSPMDDLLKEKPLKGREDWPEVAAYKKLTQTWKALCEKKPNVSLSFLVAEIETISEPLRKILDIFQSVAVTEKAETGEPPSSEEQAEIDHFGADQIVDPEIRSVATVLSQMPGLSCLWKFGNFSCTVRYKDMYSYALANKLPDAPYYDLLAREDGTEEDEVAGCGNMFVGCTNFGSIDWLAKIKLLGEAKKTPLYKTTPSPIDYIESRLVSEFAREGRICSCESKKFFESDVQNIQDFLRSQKPVDEALLKSFDGAMEKYKSGQIIRRAQCGG